MARTIRIRLIMNANLATAYIRHLLTARTAHALHSPFLFELYTKAIKHRETPEVENIQRLRRDVNRDDRMIKVEDFGAGSQTGMGTERSVKTMASRSGVSHRYGALLYRIARHIDAKQMLELGTSVGLGTSYLASALRDNGAGLEKGVVTIDSSRETQDVALEHLGKLGLDPYVELLTGTFNDVLPEHLAAGQKYDLVYIDGDHQYEATLRYFEMIKPCLHEESVVVLDDIYWSKGMTAAWEELRKHESVRQSVDLFRFGLLFFRPKQLSEHFRLRL